jgi:hypothetical protein
MMAWAITMAYEIQIQSHLGVVDHRNVQLNGMLTRLSDQEQWQQIHMVFLLNKPLPPFTKQVSADTPESPLL